MNRYLILREMKNIKIRHGDTEPEKLKSSPRGRNGEWLRQEERAERRWEVQRLAPLA